MKLTDQNNEYIEILKLQNLNEALSFHQLKIFLFMLILNVELFR